MGRAEVTLIWFLASVHTKMTAKICHLYKLSFAVRAVIPAERSDKNENEFMLYRNVLHSQSINLLCFTCTAT